MKRVGKSLFVLLNVLIIALFIASFLPVNTVTVTSETVKASPTPTPAIIEAENFEDGQSDFNSKLSEVELVSDKAQEGANSLLISQRMYPYSGVTLDLTGRMLGNESYKIDAYIMYENGPASAEFDAILCLDSNTYMDASSATVRKGEWTHVSGVVTIPKGISKVEVSFETSNKENPTKDDLMDFYIDNITISKYVKPVSGVLGDIIVASNLPKSTVNTEKEDWCVASVGIDLVKYFDPVNKLRITLEDYKYIEVKVLVNKLVPNIENRPLISSYAMDNINGKWTETKRASIDTNYVITARLPISIIKWGNAGISTGINGFGLCFNCLAADSKVTYTIQSIKLTNTLFHEDFEDRQSSFSSTDGVAKLKIVSNLAYKSKKCLFVSGRTNTWEGAGINFGSDLLEGVMYQFDAYLMYKEGPATKQFFCRLYKNDSENLEFASVQAKKGKWTHIKGEILIPKGTTSAYVYFETPYKESPVAKTDLMDYYLDNITIKPKTGK